MPRPPEPPPWASTATRLRLFWNARTGVVALAILAFALAARHPDLFGRRLLNADGGREFLRFFAAARDPSATSEADPSIRLYPIVQEAVVDTLAVAFAAMGLAIVFGSAAGLLASEAFWERDRAVDRPPLGRVLGWLGSRGVVHAVRTVLAVLRSVHELVWALLLTSVFRVHLAFGILALAIPYAASYARIFAETLDEVPRDAARALRLLGARDGAVFAFGLLPRAAKSMLSYTFYRFDCAVRSSAILGFVGFPTLGLYVRQSFNELYYREVWTWLYVLFAILIATEVASDLVRRRLAT